MSGALRRQQGMGNCSFGILVFQLLVHGDSTRAEMLSTTGARLLYSVGSISEGEWKCSKKGKPPAWKRECFCQGRDEVKVQDGRSASVTHRNATVSKYS